MPERFTLTIDLGNAEMVEPRHVADALRVVADRVINTGAWDGAIADGNGNTVGSYSLASVPRETVSPEYERAWKELHGTRFSYLARDIRDGRHPSDVRREVAGYCLRDHERELLYSLLFILGADA